MQDLTPYTRLAGLFNNRFRSWLRTI